MFTKKQENKICKQYFGKKIGIYTLAKRWNCSTTAIRGAIKRNGFSLRDHANALQKHTEGAKQKMREAQIQRLLNYNGPYKDTKPELKMKEILSELNVSFKSQFRLENHLFDFHILNTNILIEVDGDYWHGNPLKFKKLNKIQKESKQRDSKNEKLAKTNNFILLRFWENNILKDSEKVKVKICNVINL